LPATVDLAVAEARCLGVVQVKSGNGLRIAAIDRANVTADLGADLILDGLCGSRRADGKAGQ
jgi:hypothetical protein